MNHIPEHIQIALLHYIEQTATPEEVRLVEEWNASFDDERMYDEATEEDIKTSCIRVHDKLMHKVMQEKRRRVIRLWSCAAAAACILFVLLAGGYWYSHNNRDNRMMQQDINPGGNRALLEMANGVHLDLDKLATGNVTTRNGLVIQKKENGQIDYIVSKRTGTAVVNPEYHTLSTPRGGEFSVTLSDGTRVHMNAASRLRFPSVFTGANRKVELLYGEAYFEVAAQAHSPFWVQVNNQDSLPVNIQVLGTSFNVNAYASQQITTTLVSGKIKVNTRLLKPGEQAKSTGSNTKVMEGDSEAAIAWKNGRFEFNGSMEEIMEQVALWYNVEVIYKTKIPYHFVASVSRHEPVSRLLHILEETGKVHFSIASNQVIVLP
ncbi:FecR family protein [Filimonas lacunae]|uniref:FecR family protein n=1 Tax=Filimonas lacunae TaxID=477680 RepID=A0A173MJV5_9BACT|nr:FecR family protein [Filimonas lacunae]BAV07691.1 anti-sigma factor [Filimonas lacunae]SIT03578.1 FecR family protein [Filimonas lacunae]